MSSVCFYKLLCSGRQVTKVYSGETSFSTSSAIWMQQFSKFVIAGGGAGGITMAARILGLGEKDVTVIEPSEVHYYQPYWTLVGGKKKNFDDSWRPMISVMPNNAKWIKDKVISFSPEDNVVRTENNGPIQYKYLIVALGLKLCSDKIKGLPDAFSMPGVCSNYSVHTVQKTAKALEEFKEGCAIFTQPINPIKCAGAPQKIMYLADEYFRKNGKRNKCNIIFNTALGTIFSAPKYAAALREVAKNKDIQVNYMHNLSEIKPDVKEAIFDILDTNGKTVEKKVFNYEMLHVVPRMISPTAISQSILSDSSGFLEVNKHTLQSVKFPNVFGIGDCSNVPTSKTAAAVAGQCEILTKNLKEALQGRNLSNMYSGYTACPLVTGYNKGIMAEFDFDFNPLETLPIDQGKERYISYYLKKDVMPFLYWNLMLKGHWPGPRILRKILHLGFA